MLMLDKLRVRQKRRRDKCFAENKSTDGNCYGLLGGDRTTDYLAFCCLGCEHWSQCYIKS